MDGDFGDKPLFIRFLRRLLCHLDVVTGARIKVIPFEMYQVTASNRVFEDPKSQIQELAKKKRRKVIR